MVYYKATMGAPETLLRHVCSLGDDGVIVSEPVPREGHVLWARGDVVYSLHLFFVYSRGRSSRSIENLVAIEAAADDGYPVFAREFAALKHAETIVLSVDDTEHRFGRNKHFVEVLRADLIAAGRDPDAVPVVFQINHPCNDGVPTIPVADMVQALTWARCDHVEAFPQDKRGAKEALDRAIALYEEMRAEHEAK
ncbi:hypothetical protein WMF04_34200 [Sorangium sp. So ce260]|uniref:hypothetical protein n=1 Tax=Sorangium sp. So ce260 TaxID=3133291 RepID=UPI003F626A40